MINPEFLYGRRTESNRIRGEGSLCTCLPPWDQWRHQRLVVPLERGRGNRLLAEVGAQGSVDIIQGRELGPISVIEGIGFLLAEKEAACVSMRVVRHLPPTEVAGARGVTPVVAFDQVDFDRWPNDASVQARLPAIRVRASSPSESTVDGVKSAGKELPTFLNVRLAWCAHPRHVVAARSPCTLSAKDGIVTSE